MTVDRYGRAYVGHFGFDHFAHADSRPASLVAVDADRTARVVADDLRVPNGTVITSDGLTPIVGESFGGRVTAFDLEGGRSLANRPVWADIGVPPDGLCLDAEGCVWGAAPTERAIVRIQEGG